MKRIFQYISMAACLLLVVTSFISCGKLFNTPEDPEHPIYVTYTISGSEVSFAGPDQLLIDIKAWFKANTKAYDVQVNYTTGDPSEFTKTDEEAVKKYENEFLPKFNAYLNDLKTKIASGTYGKVEQVKMTLCTYAARSQGQQGTLKYDQYEFSLPLAEE
ncbi:MAG: hypothetical protein IKX56_07160 [Muribaculaceae bacterium]|nr:hypothetical protein [Muribaculaceae bacterium]